MKQLQATRIQNSQQNTTVDSIQNKHKNRCCPKCGENHRRYDKCPAQGKKCLKCGKWNHWASVCKTQYNTLPRERYKSKYDQKYNKNIDAVDNGSDSSDYDLQFHNINNSDDRTEVTTKIKIKVPGREKIPAKLLVKVDTGAEGNILPLRIYKEMCPNPPEKLVKHSDTILTAYNKTIIPQIGTIKLQCKYNQDTWSAEKFYITDTNGPAILGLPSCRNLKMLTLHCEIKENYQIQSINDLLQDYPKQFDRIGHFPGKYHIVLDPTITPVIHAPRKCPIHLKDEIKKELDKMVKDRVIKKVEEPTDWVSSLVYSRKRNGQMRICLDPKDLNKAIKRCHHRVPTLEEITHKMAKSKWFSKLDAKNGYWSIELDEESQNLTCFNSPFGRYCFMRMPFGLVMSQDVFQQKMDQILEKCSGTIGISDDVVVFGKDEKEHDNNLLSLMEAAKENGLVFNSTKCNIKTKSIKFFGGIYDEKGVHPDPQKVEDIKALKSPTNEAELQHVLGMVTYMAPFIPRLSEHTANLRDLLKKGNEYTWTNSHEKAFQRIKAIISKETTLAYFDPTKPTTIQVDASSRGLGAALLQNDRPVAFASKSLTSAEQRYANIEREMLAVVFGCQRFHTYVYGRPFTVETDHKPLEMISQKNLSAAPPRLQRMLMETQGYDLTIAYRPGKEILLADGLSRLPNKNNCNPVNLDVRIEFVQFSTNKLEELKEESRNDQVVSALREKIYVGWPDKAKDTPAPLRPYWSFRDELSVEDSLVLKGGY